MILMYTYIKHNNIYIMMFKAQGRKTNQKIEAKNNKVLPHL